MSRKMKTFLSEDSRVARVCEQVECEHPSSSYHHHLLVLALVSTTLQRYRLESLRPHCANSPNLCPTLPVMSRPCRNTRLSNQHPGVGNPPPPGFQLVLNSLLAQRDAALGVMVPSQPIARWESSSQPEILWELLAECRHVGVPPSLSQEQNAAVKAAIVHIPVATVENTIIEMETAVATSQGASPALTIVSDTFWNVLQDILPASRIPEQLTRMPSFQEACQPTQSGGSSPMDTSSDGILPPPRHDSALVTPLLALGDLPGAPIVLSSDSDSPPQITTAPPLHSGAPGVLGDMGGMHVVHDSASPPANEGGESHDSLVINSTEGEHPSDHFPSDSFLSWGRDADHPLELSSDSPLSLYHSSQVPDVLHMGSARRVGRISTSKAEEAFEDASVAVLARARYLNVVPARDTRSITPDREPSEAVKSLRILQKFAVTPLMDGSVFNYEAMAVAHEEAESALVGITDELNRVRKGFSHYFLNNVLELVDDPSIPIEGHHLRWMADIVAAVLSGGPRSTKEGEVDTYAALLPGDWYRLATFIMAAIARGCVRTPDIGRKGDFDVEPCKDSFLFDKSLTSPHTQRDLLSAVSAQVLEELKDEGALLPQDSVDGLRAMIWHAHEGQIRAWMECEVLSVYKRLSDICLSDILDKLEAEAPLAEITEAMKDEVDQDTRSRYQGLLAQEKTKAYENALEEARPEGLSKARAQATLEAA
jgi:hypothetical protein